MQASIPSKRNHPDFADFDEHQWKEWVDWEVKKHMQSTVRWIQTFEFQTVLVGPLFESFLNRFSHPEMKAPWRGYSL